MTSQSIILVPDGTDFDTLPEAIQRIVVQRLGVEFQATARQLLGSRSYNGKFPVYAAHSAEPDEIALLCEMITAYNVAYAWEYVAGQSAHKVRTGVDEEGAPIYAVDVYTPVPGSFIDWIADEVDEEGNTSRPVAIPTLHIMAGFESWVIE